MLDDRTVLGIREGKIDTRALRREATRARILESAWRLARRDGLAALSLRDLAAEVGMRAPSLYTYFPSKNDLYDAMYAQGLRELGEALGQLPNDPSPAEDLKRRVRTFARFCTGDSCRYQLIFERPIPGFVPTPESFAIGVEGLAEIAKVAHAAGIPTERGFDIFRALTTGIVGLQNANDPGGDRWTTLLDEAVDILLAHYTRQPRPAARVLGRQNERTRREGKP